MCASLWSRTDEPIVAVTTERCWCRMAEKPFGAYGVGNTFPKEASNTEDWLDAIGLVRSALVASVCPAPLLTSRGACDPQSRCKAALAGMSLVDVVNMTDSERRERVPIDGQRKRLVAFLSAHTRPCPLTGLRLICGRSRLRRYWLCRRSVRARRRGTRPPLPPPARRHRRSSTTRPPPSTSTRRSRSRAPRR